MKSAIRDLQSAFIFVLAAFAYFLGLTLPLLGPDEPRYAQVAREMFERGDLVTPTLGGHHWFEKPALLYWLEIASYNVLGVTEFAARLGPAIFGIGIILALWLLSRHFDDQLTEDTAGNFPFLITIIAGSTVGIIAFAHGASFDIILAFPITASLVCFFIFDTTKDEAFSRKYLPLAGFYFFIGIALLAKGLVGIIFPIGIVSLYHLLSFKWPSRNLILSILWGTLLASAVAAAWYLPMYLKHGYEFVDEFFIQHHFQRFTSNKYQHPQPFYFFLWILPALSIPWFPFSIYSIWKAVRSISGSVTSRPVDGNPNRPLLLFAFSWVLVPLVFFSFSGSKLPGYILPSVPAMVILASLSASSFAKRSQFRRSLLVAAAAVTLMTTIGLLTLYMPSFAASDSVKGLIEAAAVSRPDIKQVACIHNVSHNAEFYAAGRLVRDSEGKIRRFGWPGELADMMRDSRIAEILVLMPPQYKGELDAELRLRSREIADNGELAIFEVKSVERSVGGTP